MSHIAGPFDSCLDDARENGVRTATGLKGQQQTHKLPFYDMLVALAWSCQKRALYYHVPTYTEGHGKDAD